MHRLQIEKLSEDISVPEQLKLLRQYDNVFVHSYDYDYYQDTYPRHLEQFAQLFTDVSLKNKTYYLFSTSHFMSPTKLNEKKDGNLGFPPEVIKEKAAQRNILVEDMLIKTFFTKVESEVERRQIIPYLVDGYHRQSFLVTTDNADRPDFTDEEIKQSLILAKSQKGVAFQVAFDIPYLHDLFLQKKCNAFFPYGGFEFDSFIFFELRNT